MSHSQAFSWKQIVKMLGIIFKPNLLSFYTKRQVQPTAPESLYPCTDTSLCAHPLPL